MQGHARLFDQFYQPPRSLGYLKFLIFNAMGCIVWASVFVLLGYLAGESWSVAAKWVGVASKIIGGALLLAIALVWLWRWLGRHEDYVKRRWQAIAAHPRMMALRRRFSLQLEFLFERLSPQGYLGLHLKIGILLIIGASWLFGGIAEDVVAGAPRQDNAENGNRIRKKMVIDSQLKPEHLRRNNNVHSTGR